MSPFSSPEYSQGSTITASPSLTQSFLFSLPGILHILVFPSRHRTRILLAPSLCSRIPRTCLSLGSFILEISCCCCSSGESWSFLLPNFFRSEEHTSELQSHVNLVCRLL